MNALSRPTNINMGTLTSVLSLTTEGEEDISLSKKRYAHDLRGKCQAPLPGLYTLMKGEVG